MYMPAFQAREAPVMITTFRLEVITVLPEWVDKSKVVSRLDLSVRIARSRAAALAKNAACYSSVASIDRYQLGSGPAERTSETLLTIASPLRRITAYAVAIDRSTHLIQCGARGSRERLRHRLLLSAAAGRAAVLEPARHSSLTRTHDTCGMPR